MSVSAFAVVGVCLSVSAVSVIRRPVQYPVSGVACTNTKLKSKKSQMQERQQKVLVLGVYIWESKSVSSFITIIRSTGRTKSHRIRLYHAP